MDVPASTRIDELPDETQVAERILADLSSPSQDLTQVSDEDSDTLEVVSPKESGFAPYLSVLKDHSDHLVIFAASFGLMSQPFMKLVEKTGLMNRFPLHSLSFNAIISAVLVALVWAIQIVLKKVIKQ
jgi:hypothetical protein